MKTAPIILILVLAGLPCRAQILQDLYNTGDYEAIVRYDEQRHTLGPKDLFYLGFAWFQLGRDAKAVEAYEQALEFTADDPEIHYYMALALRFEGKLERALPAFDKAIALDSSNQQYRFDKALTYYRLEDTGQALAHFRAAAALPGGLELPHYYIGHTYHIRQEFDSALACFYRAKKLISPVNSYPIQDYPVYTALLLDIGLLEFTWTGDFAKSVQAYEEAIALNPYSYELYPRLIKACYRNREFAKADSLFAILRGLYERSELPPDAMEHNSVAIDEFYWNGHKVAVLRYWKQATEFTEPTYTFFLLDKEGREAIRTIRTERTSFKEEGLVRHLVCEYRKSDDMHFTYPVGWKSDDIPYHELEQCVLKIFAGQIEPQAGSRFGK